MEEISTETLRQSPKNVSEDPQMGRDRAIAAWDSIADEGTGICSVTFAQEIWEEWHHEVPLRIPHPRAAAAA